MTLFKHEMKQGLKSLLIWSLAVGGMLTLCLLMYPDMKSQMESVNEMFASMGAFTQAFGMDRLSLGTPMGFYGVEGGNVLGIGGGFFAALLGVRMLCKEEGEHTAETLLTHPISRVSVVLQKLLALAVQIVLLNAFCAACALGSFAMIGESVDAQGFWLFHLAQLCMQLELGCLCFSVSAFLKRGGAGLGIGVAALMYCLSLFVNLSKDAELLRYVTPYAYAEPAEVLTTHTLAGGLIALGMGYAVVACGVALWKYTRKDVAA